MLNINTTIQSPLETHVLIRIKSDAVSSRVFLEIWTVSLYKMSQYPLQSLLEIIFMLTCFMYLSIRINV
jgi:hypothetical protein